MPTYSEGYLDPAAGEALLRLAPYDLDRRAPELVLRGRVVDPDGEPVARAVLEPVGRRLSDGTQYGGLDGVDALAVSDERGEFALGVSQPGETLLLEVEARAFAPRRTAWLAAGETEHTIVLSRGVTVTGRVSKDGDPLPGIALGLVQQNRSAESFLGERTVGTEATGRFTFVNVPANDAFFLYGKMESCGPHGAIAVRPLQLGGDETTADAGTIAVEKGHRLSGRIVLSDGKAIPPDTRVHLSRDEAWDSLIAVAASDGAFVFDGLPAELCSLSSRVVDYHVSPENESWDPINPNRLIGRLEGDVVDFVLLLDPGP